MIKNVKILSVFMFMLAFLSTKMHAQLKPGQLVDGISAVIGDEIVLESDVVDQMNYARQQGMQVNDKCEFLESIIGNKLVIYEAKRDTLIENRSESIKQVVDQKYSQILSQFPDERTMLDTYKFRTSYELKNAIEKIDTDNYYQSQKFNRITDKADVTPNEVRDFFNMYSSQLPEVKDEVTLSHIVVHPKLSDAHKDELKQRLLKIKQDILNGETFDAMARIYSEDPGSAANGGMMKNINKGAMVKPFEAAALNLQDGEISDPVESEFGFHLIQLVKKNGKLYDARHILLKSEPTAAEIESARKELDSVRTLIANGKMTFKEAAFKYSDDKNTKFNAGVMAAEDGSDKIEKISLAPTKSYQIAGLNKGDMTDVFEDTDERQRKTVNLIRVNEIIPAHRLDIATDYERIKELALNRKKSQMLEKWVGEKLPNIFVSIDNRYSDCHFKTDWRKQSTIK